MSYIDKFPYNEVYQPEHVYVFHITCLMCHQPIDLVLPAQGLFDYRHGAYVQDAFPELSAGERELIITGICDDCFPKEDEEEEIEFPDGEFPNGEQYRRTTQMDIDDWNDAHRDDRPGEPPEEYTKSEYASDINEGFPY